MNTFNEISCSKCLLIKPVTEFYPRADRARGYLSQCKSCMDIGQQERRAVAKAKQAAESPRSERTCRICNRTLPLTAFRKRGKWTEPKLFGTCLECGRKQRIEDRDRRKAADPEGWRTKSREYRERIGPKELKARKQRTGEKLGPEYSRLKIFEHKQRRRDRTNAVGGIVTAAEWAAIKQYFDYCCLMCGRQEPAIKLTMDHVIPISKEGPNTIANIQPLCRPCNAKKFDQVLDLRTFLSPLPELLKHLLE